MIIARYDNDVSAGSAQSQTQSHFDQKAEFVTSPPETKAGNVVWEFWLAGPHINDLLNTSQTPSLLHQ